VKAQFRRLAASLIAVLSIVLITGGCTSSSKVPVTLVAHRIDKTTIYVSACSENARGVIIPEFTQTSVSDSMNIMKGDTLNVRFRNPRISEDGFVLKGGEPMTAYEEGDRCRLGRILNDTCMAVALVAGPNSDVRIVSMRLSGISERVSLRIGKSQVFLFEPPEMLTGGYVK
jgi:hypothetical protein